MSNSTLHLDNYEQVIKFTKLCATKQDLRKSYSVENGKVVKNAIANMHKGTGSTEMCADLRALDGVISRIKKNEALCGGVFPEPECHIVAGNGRARPEKSVYARTKTYLSMPSDSLYIQLLDNDPHPDGVTFKTAQEAIDYLRDLNPVFKELEILARPSSSAGISLDGEPIKAADSWHIFIKVAPNVELLQLRDFIDAACWLKGDGYIALSKRGDKLIRTTFDMTVFSPERPIFEAKPKLSDGLTRAKIATAHQAGRELRSSDLVTLEYSEVDVLKAKAKAQIAKEAEEKNKQYKRKETEKLMSTGLDESDARAIVDKLINDELTLKTVVTLEDGRDVTVQYLCENHVRYNGVAMADPVEGRDYGTTTAKFFWNDGKPVINSFAHGGIVYKLVDSYTPPATTKEVTPLTHKLDRIDFPNAEILESGQVAVQSTIDSTFYLMERYGIKARYNVVTKTTEITTPMSSEIVQDNSFDFGLSLIQSQAALNQLNVGMVPSYVNAIAQKFHYNPVVDWFKSKEWDGVSRIGDLLECIEVEQGWEGARKTYVTKWLLGAAGMQLNTGNYSTRGTLVFAGEQNIGKTYFLQMLAGDMWEYCLDGLTLNPSDRDSVKRFCSQWLVELGELDATFRKADISALKAFLTLKRDEMRLAYARGESSFPRRTVAIASVNDRQFLRDDTGNSRYWCLPVTGFNFDKMRSIDMQQLWAEVWQHVTYALEIDPVNLPWFLNEQENKDLALRNAEFEEPCEITAALLRYIKPNDGSESGDLHNAGDIIRLLQLPKGQKTSNIVGKVLREKLGYEIVTPKSKRCYRVHVPDITHVEVETRFRVIG